MPANPLHSLDLFEEDYRKNIERSVIYQDYLAELNEYLEESPKVEGGFSIDSDDHKGSISFYMNLMVDFNKMLLAEGGKKKRDEAKQNLVISMLKGFKNSKHFNISVKTEDKSDDENTDKFIVPDTVKALQEELKDLAEELLGKYVSNASGRKGRVKTLDHLFTVLRYSLEEKKEKDMTLPSKESVLSRIKKINAERLRYIIELIAMVKIHDTIRNYFYNTNNRDKNGARRTPRKKDFARLVRLNDKIGMPKREPSAFADGASIESLTKQIINNGISYKNKMKKEKEGDYFDQKENIFRRVLIPVTSDCFGNVIMIAGFRSFNKYLTQKKRCFYVVMKHKYDLEPVQYGRYGEYRYTVRLEPVDACETYDEALKLLESVTAIYMEEVIKKIEGNKYIGGLIDSFAKDSGNGEIPDLKNRIKNTEKKPIDEWEN